MFEQPMRTSLGGGEPPSRNILVLWKYFLRSSGFPAQEGFIFLQVDPHRMSTLDRLPCVLCRLPTRRRRGWSTMCARRSPSARARGPSCRKGGRRYWENLDNDNIAWPSTCLRRFWMQTRRQACDASEKLERNSGKPTPAPTAHFLT